MRLQRYADSTWRDVAAADVSAGDIFRVLGADGKPAIDSEPMPLTEVERATESDGHWWPSGSGGWAPTPGRLRGN